MSAIYHALASGPLTQTWNDAGLITANDSWAGVPSIEGFLGDIDAGSPTGVDPRTLTAANVGALDVIANQTAPNTLTNGGVAEFAIVDPVVALNGSGTADAPSLVLYLDATGQQDVRVRFNVRDLDGSADDAVQQVAVQYRIGASGTWTNVSGGYVADATTANAANQVTAVDVTLPTDAANQSQIQVRIFTTNAGGSDEWVGIDDIQVTSTEQGGGGPDVTPPALVSSNPADNATGVATSADIVLTFNDTVQAGTGDITITNGAGDVRTITVGSADADGTVTFNGSTATINLATDLAAGTAYDVIVSSGAIQDDAGNAFAGIAADALDFTTATPVQTVAIYTIQGAGHVSAFAGQTVTTQGVVTAVDSNGFYIQDPTGDGNIATSDGIFVFTSSAPGVTVGHQVSVRGQVSEFTPSGAAPGSLSITQITATPASISDLGIGPAVAATQLGGSAGRKPPTEVLDDDGLTTFDPVHDGIDFYESLEGMLVTVKNPVATGPTSDFGEIYTVVDSDDNPTNGLNATGLTDRGTILVEGGEPAFGDTNTVGGDFNPERIQIDDDSGILAGFTTPQVNAGAQLSDVTGVVGYNFGNYEVVATQAYTVANPGTLTRETTSITGSAERITIASYNVENLDPKVEDINLVDGNTAAQRQANVDDDTVKFTQIADQILNNLRAPDILALQEVQDNDGAELSGVTSASVTLQRLVDTINAAAAAAGSPAQYAFQDNPFIGDDTNGGQPGGNIRTAFIYRVDRGVDLVEDSLRTIDANGNATTAVGSNTDPTHPFFQSRLPLAATFTFNGEEITVIDNHFSSKGGSAALFGSDQPPFNGAEVARAAQAQAVNTYVDSLLATNANARVLVTGDLNEFEFEEPMKVLEGRATYQDGPDADTVPEYTPGGNQVLTILGSLLPPSESYDYNFEGNAQSLDQMAVTTSLRSSARYDVVHINSEFADQVSDHDSLIASFAMTPALSTTPTNAVTAAQVGRVSLAGAEISAFDPGSDRLFVTSSSGLQVVNLANPAAPTLLTTIDFTALGFASTDITSVAVKNGIVAVALPNADKTLPGKVVFLNAADGALLGSVDVSALPDMLTFTADGEKVLVANEGETPASGTDPDGSVSIIDLSGGVASATVQTATFTAFNGQEDALRADGVRIFAGKTVAQDVEPEYIAISPDGRTAMVTLQEANAVALLDIATATFTDIVPLGLKNWAGLQIDVSDQDGGINLVNNAPIFGMYMPDAIAAYQVGGQTYYVMANEGDDRDDFLTPDETIRVGNTNYDLDDSTFPNEAALKENTALGRHSVSNAPGLRGDTDGDGDIDQILTYGGRSFSIVDAQGNRVFDSADLIERIATQVPGLFDDTRSDNKGAEPEGITVGTVGDRTYAFVALERSNATLMFDITSPDHVSYTGLLQTPNDVSPEGVLFISATDSPNGQNLVVVSNEVSNTATVYQITPPTPPNFTLQLLHMSDGEAGLLAGDTAPIMGALIDRFDDQYANTLILSGGDNFLPGPFLNAGTDPSLNSVIGATAPGRPDIAILNAFGVETSTIGNHEFDLGSTVLRDAFTPSGAWVGAKFPYLSANLDFTNDSALAPRTTAGGQEASTIAGRIAPSAIITEGGERIGIVAATTQVLERISSPNGTEVKGFPTAGQPGDNEEVDDMALLASQLQPIIDGLIAQGVNKIVVTSHLQSIANEKQLATLLRGVDIILAAGSNTRLGDADDVPATFPGHEATFADTYPIVTAGTDGAPTLIVNTDGEYTYLGRLVVEFDANGVIDVSKLDDYQAINGAYASNQQTLERVYGDDIDRAFAEGSKGDQVRDITQAVDAVIADKDGNIFGYTDVYLEGERAFVRTQETNFGNLSADANSFAARAAVGEGTFLVSLKNGGGIRAQIGSIDDDTGNKIPPAANPDAGKPAGAISQLDIENALRFDNKLMVFDTTPQGLLNILNWGAGLPSNNGGFPQIGGVRFSFDPDLPGNNGSTPGSRIRDVALVDDDGNVIAALVDDGVVLPGAPARISVVTLNFTANGGDGYPVKANAENFRYLLGDGTLSAPVDEALDFTLPANIPAGVMGEQLALQEFLQEFHATPETAYREADTPIAGDTRIQNLNFRDDTVLVGAPINGDNGDNVIDGTAGDDRIDAMGGDDRVRGLAGDDRILGGTGDDRLSGDDGNDDIDGGAGDDVVEGGAGADDLIGGAGDDTIFGDAGNDVITGGTGDDRIKGGDGHDTFVISGTNDGDDRYDGGAGIDTLDFSAATRAIRLDLAEGTTHFGSDTIINVENLIGGSADDQLTGNNGANDLRGGGGNDRLDGGRGDDALRGDAGNDRLDGGEGTDRLSGGDGNDRLDGGKGNDHLEGGAGNDTLDGGDGNDTLIGGGGNDRLTGGGGVDHFVFASIGEANDTITDLRVTGRDQDAIVLSHSLFQGFTGDDAFDLIGSGFLRANITAGKRTEVQIDVDGGGNQWQTLAVVDTYLTNGILADHVIVQNDTIV